MGNCPAAAGVTLNVDIPKDVKSGDVLLSGGAHAAARGVLSAGSLTARRVWAVRHARHAHRGARTAARRHEAHGRVEQRRLGGAGARCVTPQVRARTCCPDDAGRQAAVHRADRQNDGVLHWRVRHAVHKYLPQLNFTPTQKQVLRVPLPRGQDLARAHPARLTSRPTKCARGRHPNVLHPYWCLDGS